MSAGIRNSLDHPDHSPAEKLAGMKLGHFAGFLKASWRANDWLWGRVDGVEYLVASVLDLKHLKTLARSGVSGFGTELAQFAFPPEDPVLGDAWTRTLNYARTRTDRADGVVEEVANRLDGMPEAPAASQFEWILSQAASAADDERLVAEALFDCCRAALASRIQLAVLAEELFEVKKWIQADLDHGASQGSSGAEWARTDIGTTSAEHVARFRELAIGRDELPSAEASSKLGLDVATTAVAVAASAFSGSRGGLPPAVRAPLAAVRGFTLVFNIIVRLLARTPVLGIAAMIAAGVALVWGLLAPNALLGALLPALGAIAIGGSAALLAMATSPLEALCRSFWNGVGLLLLVVVPAALIVFVLGLPFGWGSDLDVGQARDWLVGKVTETGVSLAALSVLAALAVAVLRILTGLTATRLGLSRTTARRARIVELWAYRWLLVLAAGWIVAGATYLHFHEETCEEGVGWACVAEHRRGTLLFIVLFGAISLAPLVAEIAAAGRWLFTRRRRPGS